MSHETHQRRFAGAEAADPAGRHATSLAYPFRAPTPGTPVEVAPGVFWLRMPLPLALDHINVYLLAAGDGWLIVDTGPATPPAIALWEALLGGPLAGARIAAVACTHGLPFRGIHARVSQLRTHHAGVLRKTLAACAGARRSAYDVSRALYPGRTQGIDPVLALGETLAHLHHLVRAGDVESAPDESGVLRYRSRRAQAATEGGEHG